LRRLAHHRDRLGDLDVLRRLTEIALGDADADLAPVGQLRKRAERARDLERLVEVWDEDRAADTHRRRGGDRRQGDELPAITDVIVHPNLGKAFFVAQARETDELGNRIVIAEMRDELESEFPGVFCHKKSFWLRASNFKLRSGRVACVKAGFGEIRTRSLK